MKTDMNTSPLLGALAICAPSIAVGVQWERDDQYRWDGSGPNPKKSGLYPHDVSVRVSIIGLGRLLHGFAFLGGCYARPNRMTPSDHDVHGYLPTMVEEAIEEAGRALSKVVPLPGGFGDHCTAHFDSFAHDMGAAITYLKDERLRRHEAGQKGGKA